MDTTRLDFRRNERFLSDEDVALLTGWKSRGRQVEQLQIMKIPFALNARNEPLVPVAAIEGKISQAKQEIKHTENRIAGLLLEFKRKPRA